MANKNRRGIKFLEKFMKRMKKKKRKKMRNTPIDKVVIEQDHNDAALEL